MSSDPVAPSLSFRLLAFTLGGLSLALLGFALGRIQPTIAGVQAAADHTHPPGGGSLVTDAGGFQVAGTVHTA